LLRGISTLVGILGSPHNPKFLWVDDAEIVGDRITEVRPVPGNFLHAVATGFPLEEEFAPSRLAADKGHTDEVESLRFAEPALLAVVRRVASKLNQAGLFRMQRQ
jgi:hypothetical protein